MIQAFIDQKLSIQEFEARYLIAFKSEPDGMAPLLYAILEELFEAVEAYWHECMPEEETAFMISEETLRREANKALIKLDIFLKGGKVRH